MEKRRMSVAPTDSRSSMIFDEFFFDTSADTATAAWI
jgi:hypothetical protein